MYTVLVKSSQTDLGFLHIGHPACGVKLANRQTLVDSFGDALRIELNEFVASDRIFEGLLNYAMGDGRIIWWTKDTATFGEDLVDVEEQ